METAARNIYPFRVTLRAISPLVWRRVLISGNLTLAELHDVLQIFFDWDGSRLHSFRIYGKEYASESGESRDVLLADLQLVPGERFLYEYNFSAVLQTPNAIIPFRYSGGPEQSSGIHEVVERVIAFESFGLEPFCRRPINKRLREP